MKWLAVILCALAGASMAAERPSPHMRLADLYSLRPVAVAHNAGKTTLLVFWDDACPPCRQELELMPDLAAANPDLTFILVTVGDKRAARRRLTQDVLDMVAPTLLVGDARATLARLGNHDAALPYAAALNDQGQHCANFLGALHVQAIQEIKAACQ